MKKIIYVLAFLLLPLSYYGQCITFNVDTILPSCSGCCDGSVTVTIIGGGCPPYSYLWSTGVNTTNSSICFDSTITLTISDAGQCCSDTSMFFRVSSTTTSIKDIHKKEIAVTVFPNPANTYLSVSIEDDNALFPFYVAITDVTGKIVLKTTLTQKNNTIEISDLPSGIYQLTLNNSIATTTTKVTIVR